MRTRLCWPLVRRRRDLRRSRAPSRSCWAATIREQKGETGPRSTQVLVMYCTSTMRFTRSHAPGCCPPALPLASRPAAIETVSRRPDLVSPPHGAWVNRRPPCMPVVRGLSHVRTYGSRAWQPPVASQKPVGTPIGRVAPPATPIRRACALLSVRRVMTASVQSSSVPSRG